MKKSLLILMLTFIGFTSFSQNNLLYTISRSNTTLTVYDTTGGLFTIYAQRPITGANYSQGLGIALNPNSNEMFILFEDGNNELARRLGTIDTLTGVVTDIGLIGNMQNIAYDFTTNKLYAVAGTSGSINGLFEVDQTTGAPTQLLTTPGGYGSAICYDYYLDSLTMARPNDFYQINLVDLNFSQINHGWVDEQAGVAMINDSITWVYGRQGPLRAWNKNTNSYTSLAVNFVSGTHSMAFGRAPLIVLSSNGAEFCSSVGTVLSTSETGTAYQWYMDGTMINGETSATYVPTSSGVYTCDVDGKMSLGVSITILPSPVVSYTATPNPVDLAVDPTGNVSFMNTSVGGHTYSWDFGNGFTTLTENPTFPFTNVGSFDVTFTVMDTINGCSDSNIQTIVVENTTGISEIDNSFSIYPNPTNGLVEIKVNSNFDGYKATLVDLNGRVISTFVLSETTGNTFDISSEEDGIYFLKLSNDNQEVQYKIVKQ